MSGMYWGLTAMHLLGRLHEMDEDAIVAWVLRCQHTGGGFGGSERNDPHMLYTLSAVQILALYDKLDLLDADRVVACGWRERGVGGCGWLAPVYVYLHIVAERGGGDQPTHIVAIGHRFSTIPHGMHAHGAVARPTPMLAPALRAFALRADVLSLQREDGSFVGDQWGEVDTRCGASSSRSKGPPLSGQGVRAQVHLWGASAATNTA